METRPTQQIRIRWPAASLAVLLCVGAAARAADIEWWTGTIEVPGQPLDFVVKWSPVGGSDYRATIDIPAQGARGLALTDITFTADTVRFTLPPVGAAPPTAKAEFELKRSADGASATGDFRQHGLTFPVRMRRAAAAEAQAVGPPRPQTPKPPFPYTVRQVEYENPVDKTQLAGELTIPEGAGPHPAVLLVTGSGAQDRDQTIFGHKPFLVIADHLSRRGIAVLRVDDRGVGGSTGSLETATAKDLANDVLAGVLFLKRQPEVDPARLGLIGHSEGGLIAPLVASRSKDVACVVLLAAPGRSGSEILLAQNAALLRASGVAEDEIRRHLEAHRAAHERVLADADEESLRAAVRELVRLQLALGSGGRPPTDEQLEAGIALGLRQFRRPLMRWFLRHDPRETLAKVRCPVLALAGSLDLQVDPKENLPEIEAALKKAGNPQVAVKELPGLNHLFQEARTGLVQEYATIEQTMAPAALDEITTWLRARHGLK